MLKIGLTGGIASGKSTVAAWLRTRGAPVVDADHMARQVVAPGAEAYAAVVAAFGNGILHRDGTIDRGALARIIFADALQRRRLETIVHPAVRRQMACELAALAARGASVVVVDSPLLIEAGLQHTVDRIWLVWVDAETQLQRLMKRDGIDVESARQRLAAQLPLDEKRQYAHVIIDNIGTEAATRRQVEAMWAAELAAVGATE